MKDGHFAYRPELDGLRAVAILSVIGAHSTDWPRSGGFGVDLFFVLSGFLITTLLLQERQATGAIALGAFYRRRVLRLAPAFAVYVIVALAAAWVGQELTSRMVLITGLHLSNVANAVGELPDGFGHLWSLAAEEQFYLVWPVVLMFALAGGIRLRSIQRTLVLLILLVLAWRLSLSMSGVPYRRIYYPPDTRADALLLGCLAGTLWITNRDTLLTWVRRLMPAAAATLAFLLLVRTYDRLLEPIVFSVFAVAAGIVVVHATSNQSRVLASKPMVWLGRLSYSLYLWHVLALMAVDSPILGLALGLGAATTSYYVIELPFLRLKARYTTLDRQVATAQGSRLPAV